MVIIKFQSGLATLDSLCKGLESLQPRKVKYPEIAQHLIFKDDSDRKDVGS